MWEKEKEGKDFLSFEFEWVGWGKEGFEWVGSGLFFFFEKRKNIPFQHSDSCYKKNSPTL